MKEEDKIETEEIKEDITLDSYSKEILDRKMVNFPFYSKYSLTFFVVLEILQRRTTLPFCWLHSYIQGMW
jgi:hypothetical protein